MNNHFSRRILAWRVVDTFAPVNSMAVLLDARRRTAGADPVPTVLSDARVEKRQRPDRRAPQDYGTIQTLVVGTPGHQGLLMFVRRASGIDTYRYDTSRAAWQQLACCDPGWTDAGSWNQPQYYRTIQAFTMQEDDADQVQLLARRAAGIDTHHLQFGPSRRWVGHGQI